MIRAGALGFDISHHQDVTEAEMRAAKANGYEFVIIRSTHGMNEVDRKFKQHYAAAMAAGLQVGVYAFYYYADKDRSAQETVNLLRTIRNKHIDLPVFIDFENRGEYAKGEHLGMLSKSAITDRAIAAISEIKKAGYTAGIYADVDWLVNKMEMSRIPGDVIVWAADWHGELSYNGVCHLRQYTSTGTVAGIGSGSVDMDRWLVDYPLVKAASWTVSHVLKLPEHSYQSFMAGTDVSYLQMALKMAGFNPGAIDGIFGENTYAAVRAFQAAKGLTVDGKAGPKTISALGGKWE